MDYTGLSRRGTKHLVGEERMEAFRMEANLTSLKRVFSTYPSYANVLISFRSDCGSRPDGRFVLLLGRELIQIHYGNSNLAQLR